MSNQLVQQLANKFSQTITNDTNQKFQQQRERLEQFGHDLRLKLGILVREMEHDIGLLRARGFDKDMYKMYVKLWNDIINIYKKIDMEKPYLTVDAFLLYVNDKHVRNIIDNLDFLAEHHLKKTNEDFKPNPSLEQPEMKSLKLLKSLTQHLESYVKANPLLPVPRPTAFNNIGIPSFDVKPEELTPIPDQEAITMPGIPVAKK